MLKILLHFIIILFTTASISTARVKLIRLDELPERADFVIEGKVLQKTARWDARGIMINTHYTIDVQTTILGDAPKTVELSFAGGTAEGKTIVVTDTPTLDVGQTYILFSYKNNKKSVPIVGHHQGIFKVIHDTQSKQDFIVDYHGYQIERTRTQQTLIRGHLTRIDENGALVQRKSTGLVQKTPITPIVRDAEGNTIPQNETLYASPKSRESSIPITRSDFIRFIRTKQRDTGAKK